MAAKHQSRKIYQLDIEKVRNAILGVGVSERLPFGFKSESIVGASKVFNLSSDINLASWGEKITVTLTSVEGGTCVDVLSECAMPTQIIDWGKNQKNVEALFSFLDRNAAVAVVNVPSAAPASEVCFCAKCGNKMQKSDKFCCKCGEKNTLAE